MGNLMGCGKGTKTRNLFVRFCSDKVHSFLRVGARYIELRDIFSRVGYAWFLG